jgi:fatty-acyl-CoA synthase
MQGMTMGNIIRRVAQRYPNREALIFKDTRLTYADFNQQINQLAHALMRLGLPKGSVVAIFSQNRHEYLEAYFACAKVGLVLNTLNWRLSPREITFMINQSDSRVLLIEDQYQDFFHGFLDELHCAHVVILNGVPRLPNAVALAQFTAAMPADEPTVPVSPDDAVLLLYTSGTTGTPKGALLTQSNVVWDAMAYLYHTEIRTGDKLLQPMPFIHVSGIHILTMAFLFKGLPVVIQPVFDPAETCRLIEKERCTVACILVPALQALMRYEHLTQHDFSSLRLVLTAAASYTRELCYEAIARLGLEKLLIGYGLTEATPAVAMTEHTGETLWKENCLGWPIWTDDVRVVTPEGADVPVGEVGELLVHGPNVFKGYLGLTEATDRALRDGWLWTGDLVRMDSDGCLFFVDRSKDMIKSGGENIYAVEVEMALMQANPEIQEAIVIATPDDKWGEAVTALLVLKPGHSVAPEVITERTRMQLASYKLPKKIHFITEVPRSISGKVQKHLLRKTFGGQ